ncbi:hypothetical protein NIIDMKKI_79840 [Mycobacterium kansasii]|uniref:Uncharacterized protein n=1 Tax=Mycobacterium kansasii TaxID=1768 RepID=A0A7G1IVE3_MYCKA|nr:hypothetical protein NIIDMKKI_79840 [Mycobacterium kansasii]
MDTFTPSIDWSNEVAGSLWWLAEAWTISGAALLAVGTLIARYTTWGRQFWEVTGGYFKGHDSFPVWGRLALLLMLVMVAVRINILLSYYSNDLYTALQVAFEGRQRRHAGPQFRHPRLLGGHRDLCRAGDHLHHAGRGRPVSNAGVHHPVAGLAHAPIDGRLAR